MTFKLGKTEIGSAFLIKSFFTESNRSDQKQASLTMNEVFFSLTRLFSSFDLELETAKIDLFQGRNLTNVSIDSN